MSHSGLSKRKREWTIRSFSILIEDLEVLTKLRELAAKEGLTLSKQIVIALKEYVNRHMPGNPQLPLDKYLTKREPGTLRELCDWCDKPAEYVFDAIDEDGTRVHTRVCRFHLESFKAARWGTFGYESLTI